MVEVVGMGRKEERSPVYIQGAGETIPSAEWRDQVEEHVGLKVGESSHELANHR